jgi:hypothetical protein
MDEHTEFTSCPRCMMNAYPVGTGGISRTDADTAICSGCSLDESNIAHADMPVQPLEAWPVLWQSFTVELVAVMDHEFTEAAVRTRDAGLWDG